jgi:hypothetical protein
MEIPHELFILSALLFAATTAIAFIRALREKERFYYTGIGISLLGLAWSITAILDQIQLTTVFWLIAMIVSIAKWPELNRFQDRLMLKVDIESPLRAADFLSNTYSGWLKLAYRHGLGATVILYTLQSIFITGGMLLALYRLYDFPFSVILLSVSITNIFLAIRLYRQIKRALTTIHPPSGSLTEK